jgi:hypothetical protein
MLFGHTPGGAREGRGEYAGLSLRQLPGASDTLVHERGANPAWSPRGDRLAYLADSALWLYEPRSQRNTKVVAIPGSAATSPVVRFAGDSRAKPSWSPDGRFVAFWLHRKVRPFAQRGDGVYVAEEGDVEDRHGLVDLEGNQVFVLNEGYWGHVCWQPSMV